MVETLAFIWGRCSKQMPLGKGPDVIGINRSPVAAYWGVRGSKENREEAAATESGRERMKGWTRVRAWDEGEG